MKYLESKDDVKRHQLFCVTRKIAPSLRKESKEQEEAVKIAIEQKFVDNQQRKIVREGIEMERHSKLMDNIYKYSGPCKTPSDVDELMTRLKSENRTKTFITETEKSDQISEDS
ncbi:hypothetical protein ElyMa_001687400 [Elysia marginata]|uniref:Uncharacterized protein n=1 Tax=Elysia marginata TaxID=1093978 RepID=A0AAV4JTW1_9GAST|nr:hypothetical protein ElyMa_001687400 [Elysia marginata]